LNLLSSEVFLLAEGTAGCHGGDYQMRFSMLPAALAVFVTAGWLATPAQAAGCLKGAAVGAVAGHVAGHHGVLGAAAGCAVGHHEAKKSAKAQQPQGSSGAAQPNSNSGH
jgi:hypothetical protein